MISLDEVLQIHEILIKRFGGTSGLRDKNLLESSLQRPFATFDGEELYPTSVEKAAAIIESIVSNHPFMDGNKRTGYTVMRLILLNENLDISASEDEKYDFVIRIAEGKSDFEQIKKWINENLKK
ncbi:death on curing protein [Salinimicrobium sediminis]|uniref:Death on curing protein n=1 Tax=Salinimicrobium sediminis TaxID=1343891 RepID=A0A285X2T1_9FLAO|nr:type II toxin-antitoxin system death-on-curing family toxin [Salinimicrobium sediminis]SOC79647.1 death on curing protein [Salinimicrobium sediminis]